MPLLKRSRLSCLLCIALAFHGLATACTSVAADGLAALVELLRMTDDAALQRDVLKGMVDGLKGQRQAGMPAGWEAAAARLARSDSQEVRQLTQSLSLTFGSALALEAFREQLLDQSADPALRRRALEALLGAKDASLAPALQRLLGDASLRGSAVRALMSYDDAWTPWLVLAVYRQFTDSEKRDALNTLASRPMFARVLVGAIEQNALPARDLTAEIVRQIRNLRQTDLHAKLDRFWGAVRESPAEKQQEIERYKRVYAAGYSQPGDASRGRAIYNRICAQCHTLFESGGKVGPDLTGSARADLDYILQNMVDPNAVIPNDYRASTIETRDERSLMGIIKQQDEKSVTIVTATETTTLPRNEVASIRQSEISMMPEGLLTQLTDQEVRDLIYYLRSPGQVPLPKAQ
jgi:putative heme-binding domain-containing protein